MYRKPEIAVTDQAEQSLSRHCESHDLRGITVWPYQCGICGWQQEGPNKPGYTERDIPPNVWDMGRAYVKAWWKWVSAGRPKRTEEETAANLAVCQAPCKFYRDGACQVCGCKLKKGGTWLGDKAAWATEDCPKGYWPH